MITKKLLHHLKKPLVVSLLSVASLALVATAGSLTPSASVGSTFHTLSEIWNSIASTSYDSSAITSSANGSLIQHLKYIEANLPHGIASNSLDFDELVSAMTVDTNTTVTGGSFSLTFDHASVSSNFEVSGFITSPGSGANTERFGANASTFTSTGSVALGTTASVSAIDSIAIGYLSEAGGGNGGTIAIGKSAYATEQTGGQGTIAIGYQASATKTQSVALGMQASTSANDTIAIGYLAEAATAQSIAIGREANVGLNGGGTINMAIGYQASASVGSANIAFGYLAESGSTGRGIAIGREAYNAPGFTEQVAIGYLTEASASFTIALGTSARIGSQDGIAVGRNSEVFGTSGIALGVGAEASASSAIAIGANAKNGFSSATAIGSGAQTLSNTTVALGTSAIASSSSSIAIGPTAKAGTTNNSIAIGSGARSYGGIVMGTSAVATGSDTIAIGVSTNVGAASSMAIGGGSNVSGGNFIAIGKGIISTGSIGLAIGNSATPGAYTSIVLGQQASASATAQFVVGSSAMRINDIYFARGVTSTTIDTNANYTIHGTGGSGTDLGGGSVTIAGGISTGKGAGGSLNFQTTRRSGTTGTAANALSTVMTITASQSVGIGTTTPKSRFTIVDTGIGDSTASGSFAIRSSNTVGTVASISATSLTTGNVMTMRVTASASQPAVDYLVIRDTAGVVYASLGAGGELTLRRNIFNHGATENCTGSNSPTQGCIDYAEEFPTLDGSLAAGDVISVDPNNSQHVIRADSSNVALGIVSTNPAALISGTALLGGGATQARTQGTVPVALAGRVPVKISEENGPILPGDHLTISATQPGYAMKATQSGMTIGIALESSQNKSQVMTFVNTSYWAPHLDTTASSASSDLTYDAWDWNSIMRRIQSMFASLWNITIEEGLVKTVKGVFGELHTDMICVGQTCVTEEQFKAVFNQAVTASVTPTPAVTESPVPAVTETPSPAPTTTPELSPTPELSATPDVTPTPSESPFITESPGPVASSSL